MSWLRPLLNPYLRLTEKRHLSHATPEEARRSLLTKARFFFHAPSSVTRTTVPFGLLDAVVLTPKAPVSPQVLLYFHGGGFVFGAPETHAAMLAALAKRTGAKAILPRYPLAPENPFPAAIDHAVAAYHACLADHSAADIIIGGDSAGGALALSVLAVLIKDNAPLPAGVFAFSPLTDLSYSGDSFQKNAALDVVLPAVRAVETADMYLNGVAPTDPRASPLFAKFEGAPPVWITVGDTEMLLDDSLRMAERLQAQGVDVSLVQERDLPHVWPLFHNILPEARRTLDQVASWIKAQTGASDPTR